MSLETGPECTAGFRAMAEYSNPSGNGVFVFAATVDGAAAQQSCASGVRQSGKSPATGQKDARRYDLQ
jgi:hypothetical protein